jgi:hypothetical protein
MNIDIRITDPSEVEFTLTATMTLTEWKKIQEALAAFADGTRPIAYSVSIFGRSIRNLISNAEQRISENLSELNE